LFEDVSQDVDVHLGVKVVIRKPQAVRQRLVGHRQGFELGITAKEAAIISGNAQGPVTLVHGAKQSAKLLPARGVDKTGAGGFKSFMHDAMGQKAGVLAEADEQHPVDYLLGRRQQPLFISGRIGPRRGRIGLNQVLEKPQAQITVKGVKATGDGHDQCEYIDLKEYTIP
jgi:hypothetical protein